jgi:sugar transferase (PEP-CTERM/EpsH1 system associated)
MQPLIVHIVHELAFGGLENGLVNLLNGEVGGRYRHAIICLTRATAFRARLQRPEIAVYELHKPPGLGLGVYPRLWRLLRQLRPQVVHTNNLAALEMQLVAAVAGVPHRLHTEHGWSLTDLQGTNPRHRRLRRLCDPFVQQYLAVSRDIGRWLVEGIGLPADKLQIFYNGIDTERFTPPGPSTPLLAEAPWPTGACVIGCVARLDPVKAPLALLAAYVELLRRRPNAAAPLWLVWIGDGPERERLTAAAAAAGVSATVWFPGARDDIPELLRQFTVFALASMNEGVSYTLLEAMASGLPVVACAVGGNPEVVTDGVTGRLVPPGDVTQFADALLHYVETPDLRRQHGGAGRETVRQRFAFNAMQGQYSALYARLCDGNQ